MQRILASRATRALTFQSRSLVMIANCSKPESLSRLDRLQQAVLGSNWNDSVQMVLNVPFMECEYERVTRACEPLMHEPEVSSKLKGLHEAFDCMFACEDVRDHINELLEIETRCSGVMGTGAAGGESVDNLEENVKHVADAYDRLLTRFPEFKAKIEQSVGHGLSALRSEHKFHFKNMHRYFF